MKRAVVVAAALVACAPAAPTATAPLEPASATPHLDALERATDAGAPSAAPDAVASACTTDEDCRLDPTTSRCGADPRFVAQPPIVDQGHLCFCDTARSTCEHRRVLPVPCEADTSCAVQVSPRPHPVAASLETPYRASLEQDGALYSVTCERTNICTMHRKAKAQKR